MKRGPLRLALIGAGRWGQNYIKTLSSMSGVDLCYVVSGNPDTKQRVPAGCEVLEDWKSLLSRELDGVIIATPPQCHAEMALAFIQQSIPVLLEKPLTLDLASSKAIRHAAEQYQSCVLVDHIYVYHPVFQDLLSCLAECNEQIVSIECVGGNDGPVRSDVPVLWDWGSHDIAMCLALMNAYPDEVILHSDPQLTQSNRGQCKFELRWSDGAVAHIHVGNTFTEKMRYVRVQTTQNVYVFDDLSPSKLSVSEDVDCQLEYIPNVSPQSPLEAVVEAFVRRIHAKDASLDDVTLGCQVVEVLSHLSVRPSA